MKKPKVLIVHNYYQVPGGEDTVVENEKKLLIENGHEVILYTRNNYEIKIRGILGKLVLPFETIFSLKTYNEVKKIIRKNNINIVHVHNTLPLISPSVYYAARNSKVPVVQTIHNFRLLCPAATLSRNNVICEKCIQKGLFYSIKNKCYRNSLLQSIISAINLVIHRRIGTYNKIDRYITLTESNKMKFIKLINEDRISVKPNFVKHDEKINENYCGDYFLYFGRIDKVKGIDFLLNSWKKLKEYKLVIAGTGPYEDEMKNLINKYSMNNVITVGYQTGSQLTELIKKSRAIVVPSQWYEPFGMVAIEAFQMGKPVIAGDIGALSSIVVDGVNGLLFEYNNHSDFIKKIKKMTSDELVKKLMNGAYESYLKNYTDKENYKILLKIYNSL